MESYRTSNWIFLHALNPFLIHSYSLTGHLPIATGNERILLGTQMETSAMIFIPSSQKKLAQGFHLLVLECMRSP